MKLIKRINGNDVELEIKKIKDYGRYSLYQVYKNGVPIYKECYTDLQIEDIVLKGYLVVEEDFR